MSSISDKLIFDMRQILRINGTHFDVEISDLVSAARADLVLGGILPAKAENESDALIKRAITCYVKAEFGHNNPDAEKLRASYQSIRQHLMLSSEYISAEA